MSIVEIAARRALQTPERLAYRFVDRELVEVATLSYGELDRRAQALCSGVVEHTAPGARVVLALPSGLDFVVALFAVLRAGRVAVPAPVAVGRERSADLRLRAIAADAEPGLLLAPGSVIQRLAAGPDGALPAGCQVFEPEALVASAPSAAAGGLPVPCELALLQYTSGSTAEPKGVMIGHDVLCHNLAAIRERLELDEHARGFSWLPMHHDMGLIGSVLQPMYAGFPATFISPLDFVQRPVRWLAGVSRFGATISGGPPFALSMCLQRVREDQLRGVDLASWRVAFVGAERVPTGLLDAFAARFSTRGFQRCALRPCYGLAEATLMVSAAQPRCEAEGADRSSGAELGTAGCGPAVDSHEIAIVDDAGEPCVPGTVGEIWVRGPSVAAGYWRRPRESARVFEARCQGRGPFLRTGDRGLLLDGELFVVGRVKELVIVRGKNHAPEDIEATVAASHPGFAGAAGAAFTVDSDQGEQLVIVHELARGSARGGHLSALSEAAVEAVVSDHGVRPCAVVLVLPGTIPRTTSGKLQRAACRAMFEAGRLPSASGPRTAHAAPIQESA